MTPNRPGESRDFATSRAIEPSGSLQPRCRCRRTRRYSTWSLNPPVCVLAPDRLESRLRDGRTNMGVAHGVRPPPKVLQRPVLARVAEAGRPRPGAGDGRGGLVSGHGMRTDFLRFRATRSAFVLILPRAGVQVIERWRRSGQESCRVPDRFQVVPHTRP